MKKEQAEWASQQRAWEQERRREQAQWAHKKRLWEEKSHKELREKEQVWKGEIERETRVEKGATAGTRSK